MTHSLTHLRLVHQRYQWSKRRQRLVMALVWRLPSEIVYWSAIRLLANATTGKHSAQVVSELTIFEALERWEGRK